MNAFVRWINGWMTLSFEDVFSDAFAPFPQLSRIVHIALLHIDSNFISAQLDTVAGLVNYLLVLDTPFLVATLTVTAVGEDLVLDPQTRLTCGVVEAVLVSSYLAQLTHHPVLERRNVTGHPKCTSGDGG